MTRANKPYLPYARHGVDASDRAAVLSLFEESAELGTTPRLAQGPKATEFEHSVKTFTGANYAIACANGTAGLHNAMVAIGLEKGEVVITQAISFCATANVVRHCEATPAFADIDADSVGLCPRSTRAILEWARRENKRVRAILSVAMGGVAHANRELYALSREFNCYLVEDAAHALGGSYDDGRPVGCGDYADLTVFSTHAVKPITSGEGGIVVTNDAELASRMRHFCNHGIEREEQNFTTAPSDRDRANEGLYHYEMQTLGLNYRLSELQAALGTSQMLRLAQKRDARRAIAERYDRLFAASNLIDILQPLQQTARSRSAHHLYLVEIDWHGLGIPRRVFMQMLEDSGIGTQVHYIPIYAHPYYRQASNSKNENEIERCYKPLRLECSEHYAERTLSLPLFAEMSNEDVQYVVDTIVRIANKPSKP